MRAYEFLILAGEVLLFAILAPIGLLIGMVVGFYYAVGLLA